MFTSRKIIHSKGLGEKLKEARRERGVGLERAAKETGIAFKYLEALEENNLAALPGEGYTKNFLKLYCGYLHLDFSSCWQAAKKLDHQEKKNRNIENKFFLFWPNFIRRLIIVAVVAAILFFLGLKVKEIFVPPSLRVTEPADNLVTVEKEIKVAGWSQPEVAITINNKDIFVDQQGKFETLMDLQNGLNLIKITAKKRYSRERVAELKVLLKE